MMAFVQSYKPSNTHLSNSRVVFYSADTRNVKQKQIYKNDSLYRRISPIGDPNVSIIPVLDQWRKEGHSVRFYQLVPIIKSLRKFNRYTHALQLSEWMSNRMSKLQPGSAAVHLDLVSKAEGLEQAEKYFNSLENDVKNFQVYGALLNCYATAKSVEKAEAVAEKMKQMDMMTTLSYNAMLNLYKKVGDNEKLEKVYQEMIRKGVMRHKRTFYIRLSSYASASDLEQVEKILEESEKDSSLKGDWNVYIIASGGYLKSGLHDKAIEMLKISERYIHANSEGVPWKVLIGMYASIGKKVDVYRVWNLYKSSLKKVYNYDYFCIVDALVKLDDIDGAEKLMDEWESEDLSFDFKIPNMLINAYFTKGLVVKAQAYVDRVVDMGKQPPASTYVLLAAAYAKKNEMKKAVEMVKKCVIAEDKHGCKLDHDTFKACVGYLKENGDLKMAEEVEITFKDRVRLPQTSDEESVDEIEDSLRN